MMAVGREGRAGGGRRGRDVDARGEVLGILHDTAGQNILII